jgi:phosphohistidine phosphatase
MKNLILIRHAKSSWDSPSTDKKRPLANRGVEDAHLVSSHIAKYLPKKSIIWSSTAKRAKDTATIFLQNMTYPLESIIFKEELYTFDVNELSKIIKSCNNSYDCVIVFGHNGAITDFVNKFGDSFVENVSTSGFVSIDFDVETWEEIDKGHTKKVVFPRDLK